MRSITIWRDVPDPRSGNAQRHDLLDILTIALVASICRCESCVDFAGFAKDRRRVVREFPGLQGRAEPRYVQPSIPAA